MRPTDCEIYKCKTPADHYRHGGRWYATNARGDIAHILPGKSAIARCEKTPPGVPVDQIPEGVRVCKTCARVQEKQDAEDLRREQNNALSEAMRLQAEREKCRLCYVAVRHDMVTECADRFTRAEWQAARSLILQATNETDVWDAFDMYRQDATRHLERAA